MSVPHTQKCHTPPLPSPLFASSHIRLIFVLFAQPHRTHCSHHHVHSPPPHRLVLQSLSRTTHLTAMITLALVPFFAVLAAAVPCVQFDSSWNLYAFGGASDVNLGQNSSWGCESNMLTGSSYKHVLTVLIQHHPLRPSPRMEDHRGQVITRNACCHNTTMPCMSSAQTRQMRR